MDSLVISVIESPVSSDDNDGSSYWLMYIAFPMLVQMKVDTSVVDFGTSVVGETLKKTVTLTNAGALPTSFQFFRRSGEQIMKLFSCLPVVSIAYLWLI